MRIHLAGPESKSEIFHEVKPPYILFSFANIQSQTRQEQMAGLAHSSWCKRALLDSGAFTFSTTEKQKTMQEWDRYVDAYCDFINGSKLDYFFELDIDQIIGLDKVEEYRKKIEKKTGKQSIPVWHSNRGWKYFERMCDEYEYVSIGGIAKNPNGKKLAKVFPWFIDYAHKTNTEIHGLGFTETDKFKQYKFDSVDSTSWSSGARYGRACQIRPEGIKYAWFSQKERSEGKRVDGQRLEYDNLKIWAQFARTMDH